MSAHHCLLEKLARFGVDLSPAARVAVEHLDAEMAETLVEDFRQSGQLTPFQRKAFLDAAPGSLVYGNYVVREPIGAGGQAEVFKANHAGLRRIDAIKVIRRDLLDRLPDAERRRFVERFEQGVRAAARLSHENIVRTYDFNCRRCFMAMEFVDGPDLGTLADQKELSERDVRRYVLHVARGLDHAHTLPNPVIHRDIKPRNLLFEEATGTIKISDWGMSRIDTGDARPSYVPSTRLTQPGEVFGSVCFMSPEQAEDTASADPRSDIYSLGCTLYTLLNRRPIYRCSTATLTMLAHCDPDVPIPPLFENGRGPANRSGSVLTRLRRTRPKQLDAIYRKMVAKRLDDRYQSMEEVIAALDDFSD